MRRPSNQCCESVLQIRGETSVGCDTKYGCRIGQFKGLYAIDYKQTFKSLRRLGTASIQGRKMSATMRLETPPSTAPRRAWIVPREREIARERSMRSLTATLLVGATLVLGTMVGVLGGVIA